MLLLLYCPQKHKAQVNYALQRSIFVRQNQTKCKHLFYYFVRLYRLLLTNIVTMKLLLIIGLLLLANFGFSQKVKTIEVAKIYMGNVAVYQTIYFKENIPLDTVYILMGRDGRYQQLIEFTTVFTGNLNNLKSFLRYSHEFYKKEENGTSEIKQGHTLSITKLMGQKFVCIYEEKGGGYVGFNESMLKKIISKIDLLK